MASDLCRVASKFCLNIPHSSSSAPRQLPPGFSTSHTLDFGLRTDRAAAECLVFFAQFPETPCLSSVPNGALNGAILVHRWSVAFCPPRDQAYRPLKPNHPRARDFAALGDAQTSSRYPKRSEDISLHSIQGATTTIWWLPPQRLPISGTKDVYLTIVLKIPTSIRSVTSLARTATTSDSHGIPNETRLVFNATTNSAPSATGSSSFDCGAVPTFLSKSITPPTTALSNTHLYTWSTQPRVAVHSRRVLLSLAAGESDPAGIGAVVCDDFYARCHNIFDSEKACEQGKLTPLVHLDGLCCVLTSNFGNDVL
ncbi:hypothetical protein B0H14DRAFT_2634791 [Mycena olivaceomarginata]|nr:hypothetical protein B0H14DRAFT_2634791 [Mycena olivaceomarginata]